MNCIFICVFNQIQYVDMLYLLLESLYIYGNVGNNVELLIYTSTNFMGMIKNSEFYRTHLIKFEINDTYNSIDAACKSRLDIFLLNVEKYEKILYIDIDIIIRNDINKLFDICGDDLLYVLEEGHIDDISDYWGKILFGDDIDKYEDNTAFTSGILLFKNCEKMKFLFNMINEDIINRPRDFLCYDQPYIVYNSFKYRLYNNKILKEFVINNSDDVNSGKVIHHFPGGPGMYKNKMERMRKYLNNISSVI